MPAAIGAKGVGMANIFVSYTNSDREWAFWIANELQTLGHSPHVHEWEIKSGEDIYAWMERHHDAARRWLIRTGSGFAQPR